LLKKNISEESKMLLEEVLGKQLRPVYKQLVIDLKGWAVLRFVLPAIVDPGRGNVGMSKPLLDLGDVSFVWKRARGGRRSHRMVGNNPHLESCGKRPLFDNVLVEGTLLQRGGGVEAIVADRSREREFLFFGVAG